MSNREARELGLTMAKPDEWTRFNKQTYCSPPAPPVNYKSTPNVIVGKPIPPPLTVRYTWDSDDDSGIGHSRGGHGGSTSSSTEAETNAHDLSGSQQPMSTNKWRWNHPPQRNFEGPVHMRVGSDDKRRDLWPIEQQTKPCEKWANSGEIRSRCDVVGGYKMTSMSAGSSYHCHDERFRVHPKNVFQSTHVNSELSPRLVMPSIHAEKQPLPLKSANHGRDSHLRGQLNGGVNERPFGQSKKWDIRRVWSYSGESSLLANSANNGLGMNVMMARKAGVCNAIKVNNPIISGTTRRPPFGSQSGNNSDKCTPQLASGLRSNQNYNWSGDGLSRTHSASLASLVTVDNVMIHAHACLAAVIPASEMGDTLSVIDVDDEQTFKSDSISSISSSLPPPPPGPPPWPMPPPPPPPHLSNVNLYSNSHLQPTRNPLQHGSIGSNYGNSQPPYVTCEMTSDNMHGLQTNLRSIDVSYAVINKPAYATVGKATYATVNKVVSKKDGSTVDGTRSHCSTTQELEETEPPLPPRNYRSELANKRLTSSKSSLSTKMNGLTRSAKQALRKAFSLEGLNCVADPHNETQEWDNAEDWVHILALSKPNTPSAVKARDAIRDKSKVQRQQMATLC